MLGTLEIACNESCLDGRWWNAATQEDAPVPQKLKLQQDDHVCTCVYKMELTIAFDSVLMIAASRAVLLDEEEEQGSTVVVVAPEERAVWRINSLKPRTPIQGRNHPWVA